MTQASIASPTAKPQRRFDFQRMNEIGLLAVIALLYVAFTLYANNFLTFRNQVSICAMRRLLASPPGERR